MRTWTTLIHALDPLTGEYSEFAGPNIQAPSAQLAFDWCQENGLGYCHIAGELVCEIPCENGKADFNNEIDYRNLN